MVILTLKVSGQILNCNLIHNFGLNKLSLNMHSVLLRNDKTVHQMEINCIAMEISVCRTQTIVSFLSTNGEERISHSFKTLPLYHTYL